MKKEAMLYSRRKSAAVRCHLCSHHCRIADGDRGFCRVRVNEKGTLYTLAYGETVARHVDPIEKKPLYHFQPGTSSYSIATAGCNFHCGFCQNWQISQAAPERGAVGNGRPLSPAQAAAEASRQGCASIAYTYTEPTIFFEYARETALAGSAQGLKNVFVTNGFMTRRALDEAAPWLDAANVDLKAWSDSYYRETCSGRLKPVLEAIAHMKKLGIWLEVTTLVIPGCNDSEDQLKGIATFIADTGREIPWHISRFHPDYRFDSHPPTPRQTLEKAERIGRDAGLKYVYQGNVPAGRDTRCPRCGQTLVRRSMPGVRTQNFENGQCAQCDETIEGRWRRN
jgi:pyruvate formate lyase activating enzyme